MIPQKKIEDLINNHSVLEKDLSSGKLDKNKFAEKSKEYSSLNEIIDKKNIFCLKKIKLNYKKFEDQNSDAELKDGRNRIERFEFKT